MANGSLAVALRRPATTVHDVDERLTTSSSFPVREVAGVPFAVADLPSATAWMVRRAAERRGDGVAVRLANAYCVALASQDRSYHDLLCGPGITFPDGLPVVWSMKGAGSRGAEPAGRVRGPSFFVEVLDEGRAAGVRHFFLGTTQETLDLLVQQATERFPGLQVAGTYAPPFSPDTRSWAPEAAAAAKGSGADLVWVALGTPKQDAVSVHLAELTGLPCAGVGAAFDFVAGSVPEAPKWVQDSGTEWLFRLVSEPKRLWRRYLFGNAQFLLAAGRGLSAARRDSAGRRTPIAG